MAHSYQKRCRKLKLAQAKGPPSSDPVGWHEGLLFGSWESQHKKHHATQPMPFFDLPIEIRSIIYELSLRSRKGDKLHYDGMGGIYRRRIGHSELFSARGVDAQLLSVCKQTTAETSECLYSGIRFRLMGPWDEDVE